MDGEKKPQVSTHFFSAPHVYIGAQQLHDFLPTAILTAWCCCFSVAVFGVFLCFGCHWTKKKHTFPVFPTKKSDVGGCVDAFFFGNKD